MPPTPRNREPVAVVLAGGGARGAYEFGVLSVLLPELEEHERPRIVVGTSVGAINVAYLAANAHRSPGELVEGGLELWRRIDYGHVLRPLASLSELERAWTYGREVLGSRRAHTESLLDPTPLASTLSNAIPFAQIRANVQAKDLIAAAVVATAAPTNLSVVFHDGGPDLALDRRRAIEYIRTELTADHVRASAAIPLLFPAVPLGEEANRRWFFDGGTRLNTPIKPALKLGAGRLIVIALNSLAPARDAQQERRPDALEGATQLIQAVLVDPLVNDVHTLASINGMLQDDSEAKARAHERRTKARRVPFMLIAPRDPAEIGRVAGETYRRHYGSKPALLRSPNVAALGRLLNAGAGDLHGELLSYLFFADAFIERLIELGRRDAEHWLDDTTHDAGRWQVGPLDP
jgi:NTE family protein